MDTIKFEADKRTITGRKVKKIRREGNIPANIFGRDVKSQAITLNLKKFQEIFKEAGETKVIELKVGDKVVPTLIHSVQKDPIDSSILHVDFHQVNLKQKVTASVPVEYVGESPAEKQGIGTVVKHVDEVEIEALPTDIPENFTVDLAGLEKVDDQIIISDLNYDKSKIEVKDDLEKIIVKVEELREEEVESVATVVETETGESGAETPAEAQPEEENTPEEK